MDFKRENKEGYPLFIFQILPTGSRSCIWSDELYNTAHEELYGNNNESKKNEKDKNNKNKRKRNSAMMVKSTDELVNYTSLLQMLIQ